VKRLATFVSVLALLAVAAVVHAESSKLDPRARAAVLQVRGGATRAQLHASNAAVSETGQLNVFITGAVTRADLEALGITVRTALPGIYTAYVPVGAVDALAARADVAQIRGASPCQTSLDVSVPAVNAAIQRGPGPNFAGINGAGVLVGDVDTGIDIHHGDFQDPGGLTRIQGLWDQNSVAGPPPSGFTIGREWTKSDIDGGLCTEIDNASSGHGTHVMGIAAGDGSKSTTSPYQFAGMAPKADIVMVATTLFDTDIVDGVSYVFARATALGENAVCNLSLGGEYGPHDGSSPFESALDAMSGPGRVICVAAGNDGGSNIHAGMDVPAPGDSMKLSITGGTTSGRFVEMNAWYNAPDNMTVQLRSPGGFITTLTMGNSWGTLSPTTGLPTSATGVNGNLYWENGLSTSSNGARLVYFLVQSTGAGVGSTTGAWTLIFTPVSMAGSTSRVDGWRDFVSGGTSTFTFKNTNDHLVSEPANAKRVISVGAYQSKYQWLSCNGGTFHFNGTTPAGTGFIASFSGIGPSRDGTQKPDITAPGTAVMSSLSADVATTCTGGNAPLYGPDGPSHQVLAGTSMATPHVTGATALLMQKNGAMTPEQVKSYLNAHALIDIATGSPWNATYGNGKLYLTDLVNPNVTVTSANGGEFWFIAGTQNITWNASDNVGVTSVDIYLSRNGNAGPWETLALGEANDGTFSWNVTGPPTNNAMIQIVAHDAAGNNGSDLSDAPFTIMDLVTGTLVTTFIANPVNTGIELKWTMGTNAFTKLGVDRSATSTGPWQSLGVTPKQNGEQYTLIDTDVQAGKTYFYRLTGVAGGATQTLGQISGTAGSAITEFALTRVAPNPSRDVTSIEFTVPRSAAVRVSVLDVAGREVARLTDGEHAPGRYQLVWTGEVNGHQASAGMYFIRMQAPGVRSTQRLVLTR
jgi:subtilisin family serine protease